MTFDPSIGDGAQFMDILQMQAALNGYSLVDSNGVTIAPGSSDLTIDVTFSTQARLGGAAETVSDETGVSLPAPDSDDPRKVLVYLDSTGSVQTLAGSPAPADPTGQVREKTHTPSVPIPNEDHLPLASIWLPAGVSDIVANDISSRRVPFSQGAGSGVNADQLRGRTDYTTPQEAADAAPVQSVNGKDGDVTVDTFTDSDAKSAVFEVIASGTTDQFTNDYMAASDGSGGVILTHGADSDFSYTVASPSDPVFVQVVSDSNGYHSYEVIRINV